MDVTDVAGESGQIGITISAHWVNSCLLVPLTIPYTCVDGVEHACRWGVENILDVPPGEHQVETYIRYRGTRANLGTGTVAATVTAGRRVGIVARNGWANHMPFVLTVGHGRRGSAA